MGQAYKCDRCGKFYENNTMKYRNSVVTGVGLLNKNRGMINDTCVYLCNDCIKSYNAWLNQYKQNKKNKEEDK